MRPSSLPAVLSTLVLTGLLLAGTAPAGVTDAPHNETNAIACVDCHAYSAWWQFGTAPRAGDAYAGMVFGVCATCHGSATPADHSSAGLGTLHRGGLGTWFTACVDCHDPHFQAQLDWEPSHADDLFLATMTIEPGSVVSHGDGTASLGYVGLAANAPAWADPARWSAKSGAGRGVILVIPDGGGRQTFEVTSADADTVTVRGAIPDSAMARTGHLVYGQFIRSLVVAPGGVQRAVRFFDPAATNGGLVDSALVAPAGLCQVCHSQTRHYAYDGSGSDPGHANVAAGPGTNCMTCHLHRTGFAHGGDGGHASCAECHASGKHAAHFAIGARCSACHDLGAMYDGNGQIALDVDATTTCDSCHVNGAGGAPAQTGFRAGWSSGPYQLDCNGCHGSPPAYANGVPKANGHARHLNNCAACHHTTTLDGVTLVADGGHANGIYEVGGGVGNVTFTYADAPTGGTCANISCHGGGSAVWGSTVTLGCVNCHAGSGDTSDRVYGNAVQAKIDLIEWQTAGHGLTPGQAYLGSGNPGAGLACEHCHAGNHDDPGNPFRLANTGSADGQNGVCLICHKGGATGFDPDGAGGLAVRNRTTSRIAASVHHGAKHDATRNGGRFCWDCHDPHGESNLFMIRTEVARRTDGVFGVPLETAPVSFTSNASGVGYARTQAPQDGICNGCHTVANHYGATYGDGHRQGYKCTDCHTHEGGTPQAGFEPQVSLVMIGGRLLRESGAPQTYTAVSLKNPGTGVVEASTTTDVDGHWQVLVPDGCYRVEPAQGVRYGTYFFPVSQEVCGENPAVAFTADSKPPAPGLVDEKWHSNLAGTPTVNVRLEWAAVIDPPAGNPVEYVYQILQGSTVVASGASTATSLDFVAQAATSYKWKVSAREAVFPGRTGNSSIEDDFFVYAPGGDCQHIPTNCVDGDDF